MKRLYLQMVPVEYCRWFEVGLEPMLGVQRKKLEIRLSPAGHILGSAYVTCRVRGDFSARGEIGDSGDHSMADGLGESPKGLGSYRKWDVVFSGDLGAPYAPLLSAPRSPYRADQLVLESTYGDRNHEDRHSRRQRLQACMERALVDGGVVLVPAFSIGRTQELLYEIEAIIHGQGDKVISHTAYGRAVSWGELDIINDSPLASRFTEVYKELRPYWDKEAKRRVDSGRHPLSFEQLTTIDDHDTHLQTVAYLARQQRPAIVVAASGMCAGGRMVNYLKALLGDKRNDVVFVGYQAQGTPGRDILKYHDRPGAM